MITFKHNKNKKNITHKGKIKRETEKERVNETIKRKNGETHKHIIKGGAGIENSLKDKTPSILSKIGKLSTILNEAKLLKDQTLSAPINFNLTYIASGQLKKNTC